jgi:hypothetical protein
MTFNGEAEPIAIGDILLIVPYGLEKPSMGRVVDTTQAKYNKHDLDLVVKDKKGVVVDMDRHIALIKVPDGKLEW